MTISNQNDKIREQNYSDEGMDLTKLFLLFMNRIWIPIVCVIAGIILGAACYLLYHAVNDGVRYQAVSKIYLDFAADETGEVYQYYNGYTWNDLMSTSPIIDETMNGLNGTNLDKEAVEVATKAEILSDIRLLTITIECGDEVECGKIQKATESSLEKLGDTAKEFLDINVVKSVEPKRIYADPRIKQACLLGALLGLFISVVALWMKLLLDDRIYVLKDLKWLGEFPILGVSFVIQNDFTRRFEMDVIANRNYLSDTYETLDVTNSEIDYSSLREKPLVVVKIPYGMVHRTYLEYVLEQLSNQKVEHLALQIVDADEKFYRRYFFGKRG